jgi:hypothetical protein
MRHPAAADAAALDYLVCGAGIVPGWLLLSDFGWPVVSVMVPPAFWSVL